MEFMRVSLVALILLLASCGKAPAGGVLPLAKVLVDPESCAGSEVVVSGFLGKAGHLQLFLTKEHWEMIDFGSSIGIVYPEGNEQFIEQECKNTYVTITGVVTKLSDPRFKNINIVHAFRLSDIKSILKVDASGKRIECWPQ
ncbi:hypothetical protein QSV34_02610 [Porticoccus sp. W117]|uniref:hypothetical protein n=1 Tax=Porticoccus sp. W117 TaxID=3054777 RepID=UPI0025939431|nr:hypothetical protein [Porticoccus sp. W117]MDM3870242.1 hypothetical protein [Porticoccus sp. W117]